ncbi:MAG: hypothetical protein GDA56_21970 [Hormoscilla sp. GM7CHS1pb]|nr:hypothetical protein [Hormoscilla sp. GM7CHS1pb]
MNLTRVFADLGAFGNCGDRTPFIPYGCYWRLMGDHSSLRIYQMDKLSE